MGIALKGDFIGFWIGNTHSSELGIIRTSDGSRFNENLLPTIQDQTVQVPGGDGFYYFGSYYTQRPFNIQIAFDNMSEAQFRQLKQIIGTKKMVQLIFDETPYKYYSVKSTGTSDLKYICFDDENNQRVYKGEGILSFIAYDPFGYARAQSISELTLPKNINGLSLENPQWLVQLEQDGSSYQYPLPNKKQTGSWKLSDGTGNWSNLINSSDLPCDYQIICKPDSGKKIIITNSKDGLKTEEQINLILENFILLSSHNLVCFDSKTGCVYGGKNTRVDSDGNMIDVKIDYNKIYNNYLKSANFAKMPIGKQNLSISGISSIPYLNIKFRYF